MKPDTWSGIPFIKPVQNLDEASRAARRYARDMISKGHTVASVKAMKGWVPYRAEGECGYDYGFGQIRVPCPRGRNWTFDFTSMLEDRPEQFTLDF